MLATVTNTMMANTMVTLMLVMDIAATIAIGVRKGGCAGMEYTMEYAEARAPHDEVVEDKGVKLLIDPSAVLFLLGTEMDYRTDRMRSGFVFNNPNQTSACGCGESVSLRRE